MNLKRISEALVGWNVQVKIAENAEFYESLKRAYPEWSLSEKYSMLSVELTSDPWGHGLLHRDNQDFIGFEPQHALLYTENDFIQDGFVVVGNGSTGDFLVIDTKDGQGEAVGYISHDALWELKMTPRSCYGKISTSLEEYLIRLSSDPDCPLEHPGWPPDENPWQGLLKELL